MLGTTTFFENQVNSRSKEDETSCTLLKDQASSQIFQQHAAENTIKAEPNRFRLSNNLASLNSKQEVESINSSSSSPSDDMDIDEENDIVNQLSYMREVFKTNNEDEIFMNLCPKDRILYANTKKHQGNQYFRENNLQQAIEAYKFGLSLLKPQSFISAQSKDCFLMAELTSNILHNMGTCYFILMSYAYAIKFYDQAILIKPNYVKAIHNRALCYFQQDNLLAALNDIKLAFSLDKHNLSIKSDLKKIQQEYFGIYGNHTLKLEQSSIQDKRGMSKSMIQNSMSKFEIDENLDDVTASTIQQEVNKRIYLEITKLSQQTPLNAQSNTEQALKNSQKTKLKSFFGKKFYRNQIPMTPKPIKSMNSSMNSPKFRPFVLNKTINNRGNKFQLKASEKKIDKHNFQNSQGQFQKREKKIALIKLKTDQPNQSQNSQKLSGHKNLRKSRQRLAKQKEGYWGYIPIVMATGYGLYHSIKAVFGK